MSMILMRAILQQQANNQGGDDGVLYDGEMTVGGYLTSSSGEYGYRQQNYGSINPTVSGWGVCAMGVVINSITGEIEYYEFNSSYPDIGSVPAHYEFGGTVYTSNESLWTYLSGQDGNTISLKVYEDAQ